MRVVKTGNSHKSITCPHCGAELLYKGADVKMGLRVSRYIVCEDCGNMIILSEESAKKSK